MPRWFVYCVLTMLLWGGWAVLPKALTTSSYQQLAFSTLGLLPVMATLLARGKLRAAERAMNGAERRPAGAICAFVAGLLAAIGNIAYYAAVGAEGGKVSVVAPLTALYPLLTVLLAMVFLGERPNRVQAAGIAIAAAAIYVFNPIEKGADWNTFLSGSSALLPIFPWGISALLQKVSADRISSPLATLWFLVAFVPVTVFLVLTQPMRWDLPPAEWLWVILLGVLFGLGNLTFIAANAHGGKASVVTPLAGLYSLVTLPLAWYFFGETLGTRETIGVAAALAAVVALSWEKRAANKPFQGRE